MLTSAGHVLFMNRLPFSVNSPNFTGIAYVLYIIYNYYDINFCTKLTTGITIAFLAEILSIVDNLDVTQSSLKYNKITAN